MIHKLSIPARNPQRVARVLAALLGGRAAHLELQPGAFSVRAGDRAGTVIDVMPATSLLVPGDGSGPVQVRDGLAPPFLTTGITLSVERTNDEVLGIAEQAGWRAVVASRGTHEVIEVWVENRVLVEVLTPGMRAHYLSANGPATQPAVAPPGDRATQRFVRVDLDGDTPDDE